MTPPKITIIIPVYNVEKYLAECLDSVVNQTMRDIQIICVNDGSTDNSLTILQEYADRDSRIEIIDKPNGGVSSARNAAFPYIKGKYTQFVDSDDWIKLDTCEKIYHKAEESNACMVFFFLFREERKGYCYKRLFPGDKTTVEEKSLLLSFPSVGSQLWRTDFLFYHRLHFPEGLGLGEDLLFFWKGIVLAKCISLLPEELYYYRDTPKSAVKCCGKLLFDVVPIFRFVRHFLEENGYYHLYGEAYHEQKLLHIFCCYARCSDELKSELKAVISQSLTDEDREYYRSGKAGRSIARFYKGEIDCNIFDKCVHKILQVGGYLERTIRRTIKPKKKVA